jgi:predicted ABC-type transport system involved in lysophospholipase L1 biosynthesis ATPase subunit
MSEQIIAVQSISKSFGENSKSLQVLEDLSLNLNIGESRWSCWGLWFR